MSLRSWGGPAGFEGASFSSVMMFSPSVVCDRPFRYIRGSRPQAARQRCCAMASMVGGPRSVRVAAIRAVHDALKIAVSIHRLIVLQQPRPMCRIAGRPGHREIEGSFPPVVVVLVGLA